VSHAIWCPQSRCVQFGLRSLVVLCVGLSLVHDFGTSVFHSARTYWTVVWTFPVGVAAKMVSTLLRLSEPLPAAASTGAKQYSTTNSYDSNKVISVQASDFGQFCSSNKDDLLVAHATNTDAMPVYWNRHTPFVHNSEKSIRYAVSLRTFALTVHSENIRTYLLMPVQEAMNALKESIFGDTGANLSVVIVPQAPATVLKGGWFRVSQLDPTRP
jgi:hypothetical protein